MAWFEFSELCEGPRSQNDYIELAHLYHTVFVSNIPVFTSVNEDAARRFIMLIDEMYDRGVKLVVSAAAAPDVLYRGERLKFEFERAASRLIEMQLKPTLQASTGHNFSGLLGMKHGPPSPGIIRAMKMVAEFKIHHRQILGARGETLAPLPSFAKDAAEVLKMYRAMTLVRVFDTKAVNLQRTGQLGTYPSSLGHEATHVGIGAAMRPEDVLAPVYREYGTQLWRGVTMTEILTYWGGDERGNDFAVPRADFAWCVPIATQTLHAAGAAMAFKIRKEPRCALAYIGDGGTSEGAFYEALNLAGARALPVVFVIVNNGWAISVPVAAQTATQTLAQKAVAAGIPGVQVDGNDVFAVREVVAQALESARRGAGPTLVEALTYRLSDHTTADDASRYRAAQEVQDAWAFEPMIRIRRFLDDAGLWDSARETALLDDCAKQVDAAVGEYLKRAKPSTDAMFDHLFATLPTHLREQRLIARKYGSKSGGH